MGKTSAHKAGHGPNKISGGLDNLELVYFWGSEFLGASRFSQWAPGTFWPKSYNINN